MILGMTPSVFIHVIISLIAIAAGLLVVAGLFESHKRDAFTLAFLATTIVTCLTGFALHADHILPSHIIGLLTLFSALIASYAFYKSRLLGSWRWIFVTSAMLSLYLNVFVLVFQAFLKIPLLHGLAPTQSELPFAATQVAVLFLFAVATWFALKRFHPSGGYAT